MKKTNKTTTTTNTKKQSNTTKPMPKPKKKPQDAVDAAVLKKALNDASGEEEFGYKKGGKVSTKKAEKIYLDRKEYTKKSINSSKKASDGLKGVLKSGKNPSEWGSPNTKLSEEDKKNIKNGIKTYDENTNNLRKLNGPGYKKGGKVSMKKKRK